MTRYVQKVLQPDETVTYESKIHWLIYLPAMFFSLFIIAGLVILAIEPEEKIFVYGPIGLGLLLGLPSFLKAWFTRWTTEIAVTNRRVIYKRGFIRRITIEMNMDKVESIDVNQSILGRMFDYGDVLVRGTGHGLEPLHMISSPLGFRNAVIAR
jgi:uncharacterized membrane protein YdbT with pleckstrin-like domain